MFQGQKPHPTLEGACVPVYTRMGSGSGVSRAASTCHFLDSGLPQDLKSPWIHPGLGSTLKFSDLLPPNPPWTTEPASLADHLPPSIRPLFFHLTLQAVPSVAGGQERSLCVCHIGTQRANTAGPLQVRAGGRWGAPYHPAATREGETNGRCRGLDCSRSAQTGSLCQHLAPPPLSHTHTGQNDWWGKPRPVLLFPYQRLS